MAVSNSPWHSLAIHVHERERKGEGYAIPARLCGLQKDQSLRADQTLNESVFTKRMRVESVVSSAWRGLVSKEKALLLPTI